MENFINIVPLKHAITRGCMKITRTEARYIKRAWSAIIGDRVSEECKRAMGLVRKRPERSANKDTGMQERGVIIDV